MSSSRLHQAGYHGLDPVKDFLWPLDLEALGGFRCHQGRTVIVATALDGIGLTLGTGTARGFRPASKETHDSAQQGANSFDQVTQRDAFGLLTLHGRFLHPACQRGFVQPKLAFTGCGHLLLCGTSKVTFRHYARGHRVLQRDSVSLRLYGVANRESLKQPHPKE
ncbi:hypothetical protein D9M68_783570 [compost metagenome]